jgi:AcrR family transcriptional regulator
MARWASGTPERLQQAALALFATTGFEQTTATQIAEAVGLTERTFFRHFSDKREVLFYGQDQFVRAFLAGVDSAPPDAAPMAVVAAALHCAGALFPDGRRGHSRIRQTVIDQNPALQEREAHKLAGLATALADALRSRGVADLAATLAAQAGVTVFAVAFGQWIRDDEHRSLPDIAADVLHELAALTTAVQKPAARTQAPGSSSR